MGVFWKAVMNKNALYSAILLVVSTLMAIAAAEGILRIKNNSMKNYDIEMWRYAKELKIASPDPVLAHDHVRNATAVLQSVPIRLNEWGLRGGPVASPPPHRRILFLGGSITLGWGVPEDQTVTQQVERVLHSNGEDVEVLNGGVGNYNAARYVERFFTELRGLDPTDIVVQYFLRDAEELDAGGGNFILRHSELAVTLWIAATRLLESTGENSLVKHYENVYRDDQPGFIGMKDSLQKLADYCRVHNIRIYLAMTPDVHNLANYPFGYIHEKMKSIAEADGYRYVDLLPAFGQLTPNEVWAMPGDPHPNALGHALMAKAIAPVLAGREVSQVR
jgi:lysophospholipase L1-like esterase